MSPTAGENSYVTGTDFVYGDSATYNCNEGYEIDTGDVTRNCQADATWTGSPLNCKREHARSRLCVFCIHHGDSSVEILNLLPINFTSTPLVVVWSHQLFFTDVIYRFILFYFLFYSITSVVETLPTPVGSSVRQ